MTFVLIELLGRTETGIATEDEVLLLRLLTPLTKLTTGKQSVHAVSESIEAFGGAGYLEDTGLPVLLRDTQVLPIWEGTTNVLALDLLLRADVARGVAALERRVRAACDSSRTVGLGHLADTARDALAAATAWLQSAREPAGRLAGARRFALTLGRATELALLAEHAAALPPGPERAAVAELARRFQQSGINLLGGAA